MIKQKVLFVFLLFLACILLPGTNDVITLKTENMDEVVGISSFLMNTKGEIFLFSSQVSKVFKFRSDGTFDKSFCRRGEGPGEVNRVFSMFSNPVNDYLYLPEYVSGGKGRITMYDSDGHYQGLLTPDVSREHLDRVWKIIFLKDGSYILITNERVDWEPVGKFFITRNEIWARYFKPDGQLISSLYKTKTIDELSHAPRYGGPQILFKPTVFIKLTPDEEIAVSKNDENEISIYDIAGKKIRTITLDIPREKLSNAEFQEAKKGLIKAFEKEAGSRMHYLAKNMIKLDFKPIYWGQFLISDYVILARLEGQDDYGFPKKTRLLLFTWEGKKVGEKVFPGAVYGIKNGRVFIVTFDDEGNEHFKIQSNSLKTETRDDEKQTNYSRDSFPYYGFIKYEVAGRSEI